MKDLTSPTLIWLKAGLFLVLGVMAAVLLLAEAPTVKAGVLLTLTVWAFCRAYYFCFYVIEHYLDPAFRFAGLGSVIRHMLRRRFDA